MRRLIAILAAAILSLGLGGAAPASADPVPGDQPLPGYTINNPPLTPATVGGLPARVLQGVHEHAAYDIEVPPSWNGDLAMYAHGFAGQGKVLTVGPPPFGLRQRLLDQGYAWAASSNYANGYDVRAGVLSTHDLALLFHRLVRRPHRTFAIGASMGGHVVGRSIEQFPGFYAGALPFCGVLGDHTLFDYFLDYNLVAQGLAGLDAFPLPPDYLTKDVPLIQKSLGIDTLRPGGPDTANDRGRQFRAITIDRSGGDRPGAESAFAVWKDYLFSLAAPPPGPSLPENPGQVATNVITRYQPNTPVNINREVERVPPENLRARFTPRLNEVPQIFGVPTVPVLSVHGMGDLFVPLSMEQAYRSETGHWGRSRLVVQRAIRTTGHCEFSAVEAASAWDDLVAWVKHGVHPAGDDVLRPGAATFGCRFSDPAAYAAGTGSRRLYSACPA